MERAREQRLLSSYTITRDTTLAQLTGANEVFLTRVLRFLVGEGIFRGESDTFALNERSHWLQSGIDGSVRSRAVLQAVR